MAFTQSQLDAIENAISGGELTVEYQDKRVTYRSLKEMMQIRDMMRKDLDVNGANSSANRSRVYMSHRKGFERA